MTSREAPATFELLDGIGHVVLADPDRGNCMDLRMVTAILDATERARRSLAQVVVVSAQGRFWSVGGDLASFAEAPDPSALIEDVAGVMHRAISQLLHLDAIVIAAVQGSAAGAGLPLALAADLIVAAESAKLTLAYTKVGLSPDCGSTALLPATLGVHRALRLALLNPVLAAREAEALGLVTEVVADGAAFDRAMVLARGLADGPVAASVAAKRLIRGSAAAVEAQMELEARAITALAAGPEARAGLDAFVARRGPGSS